MNTIYGVNPDKFFTPLQVRDAIVECFYQAHGEVEKKILKEVALDFGQSGLEKISRGHVERIVRRAFAETGGDYSQPDKNSIIKAMDWLADFSKNFRNQKTIKKHYEEIMQLVEKLE